jgi:hypothetical protein
MLKYTVKFNGELKPVLTFYSPGGDEICYQEFQGIQDLTKFISDMLGAALSAFSIFIAKVIGGVDDE